MTKYCRYCCWLCVGDAAYCGKKKKVISDKQAKHSNDCKWFDFNEIDAFGERLYKPRKEKPKPKVEQTRLF